jgi:hypothetical protein
MACTASTGILPEQDLGHAIFGIFLDFPGRGVYTELTITRRTPGGETELQRPVRPV